MKSKWIIVIAVLVLVVVGCLVYAIFGTSDGGSGGNQEPGPVINESMYRDVPTGQSFRVDPGIVLDKAVAPAFYQFGSLPTEATIDTWTMNGTVVLGKSIIGYQAGDSIWLLLYNGLSTNSTFQLQLVNAPEVSNPGPAGVGGLYAKAPEGFVTGITVPNLITVEPYSCYKVPLNIHLAKSLEYPEKWEFRILVTTLEVSGQVTTGLEVRYLCSMR